MPAETVPKSLGGAGPEPDHISLGGYVPRGALAAEAPAGPATVVPPPEPVAASA